jgi:hypothetical protein
MICRNSVLILANQLTRLLRAVTGASMEKTMKRTFAIGDLLAVLTPHRRRAGEMRKVVQRSAPFFNRLHASCLILGCIALIGAGAQSLPTITQAGPTVRVEQIDGPCDWSQWDPKSPPTLDMTTGKMKYGTHGPCGETAAQAVPSQVLAQGLGYSFEDTATGNLILLFGDTVGYDPTKKLKPNPAHKSFLQFNAKDTIAVSSTSSADDTFSIQYKTWPNDPSVPLFVTTGPKSNHLPPQPTTPNLGSPNSLFDNPLGQQPKYVPADAPVLMGPYDIPTSGISLKGETYMIVQTGAKSSPYSVLVNFNGVRKFTTGRTVSETDYNYGAPPIVVYDKIFYPPPIPGHFVYTAMVQANGPFTLPIGPCDPPNCFNYPVVAIYGNGQSRDSSLYFSYIPVSSFWSGEDGSGNPATVYFAGYGADGKTPEWTNDESAAQPLFWDDPPNFPHRVAGEPDPGQVGNASLFYDSNSSLWMMIYDHFDQTPELRGIYFSYAELPWGPWQKPQLIYNPCQAHQDNQQGLGDFIFYYTANVNDPTDNTCPSALDTPASPELKATKVPGWSGPAGPVIGGGLDPFGEKAFTTRGTAFAPEIIGRFSGSKNGMLRLQYNISTWNPYAVVRMETDFTISR